jgi:hypothetical protein
VPIRNVVRVGWSGVEWNRTYNGGGYGLVEGVKAGRTGSVSIANRSTGAARDEGRGGCHRLRPTDRVSRRTPATVRLSALALVAPFAGAPIFPASGVEEELGAAADAAGAAGEGEGEGEGRRVSCARARPLPLSSGSGSGVADGWGWVNAGMESSSKSSSSSSSSG